MEFEKIDIIEAITVIAIGVITVVALYTGSSELAAAGVGGLVGYLTKGTMTAFRKPTK